MVNEVVSEFEKELTSLINRFSKENGSNTPDFIMAKYLVNCMEVLNNTVMSRGQWHGDHSTSNLGFFKTGQIQLQKD